MKSHRPRRFVARQRLVLAGTVAVLLGCIVQAADQVWNGGSTANGSWATSANWVGNPTPPGSTGTLTNTDVGIFNGPIANTWGISAVTPVAIDLSRDIGGIKFDGAAGNYFIGSTGGSTLLLTSGGAIQILSTLTATNAIETINAPLQIQSVVGSFTLANYSATGTGAGAGTLNIGGGITGVSSGTTILNLVGSNKNANTISGVIANGGSSTFSVIKQGTGTWVLAANNTYTGGTTVTSGTLVLDYTASNTSKLADNSLLTLGSGTLQLDRSTGATGSHLEIVSGTSISGGATITRGAGSTAVLQMGTISRNGGTLNLSAAGIATTSTTNTNGLLGSGTGWATIGGTDWATNSTNGNNGSIVAYSGYTNVTRLSSGTKAISNTPTANVRIVEGSGSAANLTLAAATTTINTLNQSASGGTGAATIDLAGGTLAVNAILLGSGAGALTIGTSPGNGSLTAAALSNGELILQNFSNNALTINANLTDAQVSALSVGGTGTTILAGGNNNYLGSTMVSGGTLQVSGGGKITGTSLITVEGGVLTATGAMSGIFTSSASVFVGRAGNGTLNVLNGGTASGSSGTLGDSAGSTGTVLVDGIGSTWAAGNSLTVGNLGSGALTIQNGGMVSSTNINVGFSGGSSSAITVSGIGSVLFPGSTFNVGFSGSGTLLVQNGGTVVTGGSMSIGNGGTVTVSDAGSTLIGTSLSMGTGALNIQNAGLVMISTLSGSAATRLNLNGGTLRINASSSNTIPITLGSSGGTFDIVAAAGISPTPSFSGGISGPGGLVKTGVGTLVLMGASTYSGGTQVNGGTLQLGNGTTDGTITGDVTLNGGTLNFNNASAGSYSGTIHVGGSVTKTGAGNLTLGGVFDRQIGGLFNVQGTGTVTATMTGLSENHFNGIIGAWATFGSGASIRYAAFSGSTLGGYTGGTAAATVAALTDVSGILNYDLAATTGTAPLSTSANTIRYTGIGSTQTLSANSFSVNGLLNSGSGVWILASNTLTIGSQKELILNGSSGGIAIQSIIQDNAGGASALVAAGGTVTLTGANTYSGPTIVTAGVLGVSSSAALGNASATNVLTLNGGTLQAAGSFTSAATRRIQLNGTSTVDTNGASMTLAGTISGSSTANLVKIGSGTLALTGTNTYSGSTIISGGALNVSFSAALGDASATNLLFLDGGTLQAGASFTLPASRAVTLTSSSAVDTNGFDLVLAGALSGSGTLTKNGSGTLTFAGGDTFIGGLQINSGTVLFDYTASNSGKLSSSSQLTLGSATLQLDRSTGATGTYLETISGTTLNGGAFITRGAGSSAVLQMGGISRTTVGTTINFSASGIATTNTQFFTTTNGLLGSGTGWATVGGTDFATAANGSANSLVTAYTGYTNLTRQSSGTKAIADSALANVRIIEGTGGGAANLTLGAATTTINTLNQSASGGTGAATIDLPGKILATNAILLGTGAGALTVGTTSGSGTLKTATSGGELILQNFSTNTLTVNSNIADNSSASVLTVAGLGTTLLTGGNNTYSGKTSIVGGTLQVSGGGKITATSSITADGGSLTVDGTTASSVTSTGSIVVANAAASALNLRNGGTLATVGGTVGSSAGAVGMVTVTGANSKWTSSSTLTIGSSGAGVVNILNGGTISGTSMIVASSAGSSGAITVNGAGSTWTGTGPINLGSIGTGTLLIQNGGNFSNTASILAGTTGFGNATVTGAGSTWTMSSLITVGSGGSATLNIQSGGTVSNTVASIGMVASAAGTVTVDGTGSTWANSGSISFGSGASVLNVQNSGLVVTTALLTTGLGGNRSVTFDAGTLRLTSTNTSPIATTLLSGGGTYDIPDSTVTATVSGVISGAGSLSKTGAGTLALSATNNYTGATTVSAGTLAVSGKISGTTTVSGTGTLTGIGGTTAAVNVTSGGTLAPGSSTAVGTLNTGALSLTGTATFKLEINTGTGAMSKDIVTGNFSLDSSKSVVLTLADVGNTTALTAGLVFPIIDYSGTWNGGTFAGLPNGSIFTAGINNYRIQYNGVDAGNGNAAAVTLTTLAAVPEPGSIALLGLGGLLLAGRRRRRIVQ